MNKPETQPGGSLEPVGSEPLRMRGENARIIIENAHALLRRKFRGSPLWSMVGQLTGHGSGYSHAICESANLDPGQLCSSAPLRDYVPNH